MSKDEYDIELKELQNDFNNARMALGKKYALANNKLKVGDIFNDHIGSIKIEKIEVYHGYGNPCCAYTGSNLTKGGTVNKKEPVRTGYQSNQK